MRKLTLFFSIFLILLSFNYKAVSQTAEGEPNIKTAENAAEKLRELYKMRDFEAGYELGQKFVKQFPESSQVRAWFIINSARNFMSAEAVEMAEKFTEEKPNDSWAWFALANAYIRNSQNDKALSAAKKLLRFDEAEDEFIFTYTSALLLNQKPDEIQFFLAKNYAKIKDKSRFYGTKGEAFYRLYYLANAEKKYGEGYRERFRKLGLENFETALKYSPNSANANYVYGLYLNYAQRFDEALPVLKKAAELSPDAADIRKEYWKAVYFGQDKKAKDKVLDDAQKLIALKSNSLNTLINVAAFYREIGMPEKLDAIAGKILSRFPQSEAAEGILYDEIRTFRYFEDNKIDENKKQQFVKMLRSFQNRLKHYNEANLGESYVKLFDLTAYSKEVSDKEILDIAEKISELNKSNFANTYSRIVSALTERKLFEDAERFVNISFEKVEKDGARELSYVTDKNELKQRLGWMISQLHSAKGWVYFKSDRIDEAQKELEKAVELNKLNSGIYYRSGQIYEAQKLFDKAEDAYIRGFASNPVSDDLNKESLESLYKKRGGNAEDFDKYFGKIEKTVSEIRRENVVNTKLETPKDVTPFALKKINHETISSNDLKGKVVVINIWGTWCGPCVSEMPEFQKLHEKYAADKDVEILTINNDSDLNVIKKFMSKNKYDFHVLRDENYLDKVGVNLFPTTWFIGKNGKISYVALGSTTELLDEFSWRIEELKSEK